MLKFQDSKATDTNLELEIDDYLEDVAIALVILGGFVFLIGILGCFGICCKNKGLLIAVSIFLGQAIVIPIQVGNG